MPQTAKTTQWFSISQISLELLRCKRHYPRSGHTIIAKTGVVPAGTERLVTKAEIRQKNSSVMNVMKEKTEECDEGI